MRARPNPICASLGLGKTELVWAATGPTAVEVRVDAPDGPLLARSDGAGSQTTGPWVSDGTTFFLQDVSGPELPLGRTLDRVIVRVTGPTDPTAEFSAMLGRLFGCTHIAHAGAVSPDALAHLALDVELIDLEPSIWRRHGGGMAWFAKTLRRPARAPVSPTTLAHTLLLATGMDRSADLDARVKILRDLLQEAPVGLLFAPVGRTDVRRLSADPALASEEFERRLQRHGLNVAFAGVSSHRDPDACDLVAVVERSGAQEAGPAPRDFRVAAIVAAYNEEDVIVPSIQRLLDQGIAVHLIDNGSTDETFRLAQRFCGHERFTMERFPATSARSFSLRSLLERVEVLSREIRADWFIHHDVDEVRRSPWPGVNLRDALYRVDRSGFDCVDHTVLEFHPVDDSFLPGTDLETHFKWFEFGRRLDHFMQVKAWKQTGQPVALAASGGHEVVFPGRRIFPYKFLLKHYPIRSERHGRQKVFMDRKARWDPAERAAGWHLQYDAIDEGHRFLRDRSSLEYFDEVSFNRRYLVERLSSVRVGSGVAHGLAASDGTDRSTPRHD